MNAAVPKRGEADTVPPKGHDVDVDSDDNGNSRSSPSRTAPSASSGSRSGSDTSSVSTVDSDDGRKVTKRKKRLPSWAFRMLNLAKDITIMVLVAVTYAALSNDPPKVTKGPAAYPFFSKESHITDWYRGQVSRAIEQARTSDISFIMFYAPWDAESQNARKEFELAARYMRRQVTFAAVNCWQPGTECRNQYSKVFNWPVLIAYPSHGRGIQYNGPILAPHIIRFLQNICRPFTRVRLPPLHEDAYILVEVDASPYSYDYAVAYSTSLRLLEKDPLRDVPFIVTTRSDYVPKLSIVMSNETLIYNNKDGWKTDLLLTWIMKNLRQIAPWVSPSGMKSLSLSHYIKPGPALVLFTPRNPLLQHIDYKLMLQTIGHDYYLCEDGPVNALRNNMSFFGTHATRLDNYVKYNKMKIHCDKSLRRKSTVRQVSMPLPNVWTNYSCCSLNKEAKHCDKCQDENYLFRNCGESNEGSCLAYTSTINQGTMDLIGEECQVGSGSSASYKTSMWTGENDPLSPQNLNKRAAYEECIQFLSAEHYAPPLFASTLLEISILDHRKNNVLGLGCISNSSLYMVAMDSLLYYHFAEKLGVNVLAKKDKSAAVIVNEKMETHHIMEEEVNDVSLKEFIANFTQGTLKRALETNSQIKSKNIHSYAKLGACPEGGFCVRELDTRTFLPTVHQHNKAVIVMYYSKQCAFCNGVSYAFLIAARKLADVDNIVFARIDGDLNLLPWEYTMYSYPTILFFPAVMKSNSRAFPKNIPITVENLLGFVLTNLEPSLKIQAMWSICNQTQFVEDKSVCLSSTRLEILSLIETTLRQWRKAPNLRKRELFRKLQLLRHVHLLSADSLRKAESIKTYFSKLHNMSNTCGNVKSLPSRSRYKDEL